jgi:uncharacterized protein YbaP (TraB family)
MQTTRPWAQRPLALSVFGRKAGIVAFGAALGLLPHAPAQADPQRLPTAQPAKAVAAPNIARPALWKITRPGVTFYLFGTVHILPKGLDWYDGAVAQAFSSADTLVTEVIEGPPDQMQTMVAQRAIMPENTPMLATLSPKCRANVQAQAAQQGVTGPVLSRLKPWYLSNLLVVQGAIKAGYDPADGADGALTAKAKALGKRHEALETVEFQLDLFNTLPPAMQRQGLCGVARKLPTLGKELGDAVDAWKTGNPAKLDKLMNDPTDPPLLRQKLLLDRNRNWTQWVKARMAAADPAKPQVLFIAVGAGHLAGKGSLLDQLGAQGIAATRLQ